MTVRKLFISGLIAALAAMLFVSNIMAIGMMSLAGATPPAAPSCVKPGGGGGCFSAIQPAIDAAAPGSTIKVYAGTYSETATNRSVIGAGGGYTFGLFIGQAKSGITIQGVDSKGKNIKDFRDSQALVNTNATNDFGPSGIFVEGDNVTIAGVQIGTNSAGQNKTIEVTGDNFTLKDCDIYDIQGSVYIGDFRFDTVNNKSHIRSYRIEGNNFQDGVSIDIANGAGLTGSNHDHDGDGEDNRGNHNGEDDHADRVIKGNTFANSNYWPSISFNGSDTGVPWFVYSVGGAVIKENKFVNTFVIVDPSDGDTEGFIRARGTYDNSEFDWESYWNNNKYNHAYVVGPNPPRILRTYSYLGYYGPYQNVRRIGAIKSAEQAHAQPGDRVLTKIDH